MKRIGMEVIHKPTKPAREHCMTFLVVGFLIMTSIWNVWITISARRTDQEIGSLRQQQERLEISCRREVGNEILSQEKVPSGGDVTSGYGETLRYDMDDARGRHLFGVLSRQKRNSISGNEGSKRNRASKKQKKSKNVAIHLKARFDEERYGRQLAEGNPITTGIQRDDGSVKLNGKIYNVWQPSDIPNQDPKKKLFYYNEYNVDKVKIKKQGIYLIYAQVTFHRDSDDTIFGIYVNNEYLPLAECIGVQHSLDGTANGTRKSPGLQGTTPTAGMGGMRDINPPSTLSPILYADYIQCQTNVITFLNRSDEVFIKTVANNTFISVNGYLTFWGLVKF